MHAIVAMLHIIAITAMLLTRLKRSTSDAIGIPTIATVTDTTDTSEPSC